MNMKFDPNLGAFKTNAPFEVRGVKVTPGGYTWIPPEVEVIFYEPYPILTIRLHRSSSGNHYCEVGNNFPPAALNDSRRNPILRGVCERFCWRLPHQPWGMRLFDYNIVQVAPRGSDEPQWAAIIVAPAPDPFREWLNGLNLDSMPIIGMQGHLVHRGDVRTFFDNPPPVMANRIWRVYNHWFSTPVQYRVVRGMAYIVTVSPGVVMSDDHPAEPIEYGEYNMFTHTLPPGGRRWD